MAIIYLDKIVAPEEKAWALKTISHPMFNEAQRATLLSDLEKGIDFNYIISKVTDKKDLTFVIDTFRVLANIDKNFSKEERDAFNKLEEKVLGGLNLKEIEKQAVDAGIQRYHEDEVYKTYNSNSIFEKTFNNFLKFINPGDYKFPKK
jgi:hypothetical protein